MTITYCLLFSAAEFIPAQHPLLIEAKKKLYKSSALGEEYYKTWHSIIWIASRSSTKRRVKERLNNIAFDAYSYFIEATECLDKYAVLMNKQKIPQAYWWVELGSRLESINESFYEEHSHEINSRQLAIKL
jgi:hypothetical protein